MQGPLHHANKNMCDLQTATESGEMPHVLPGANRILPREYAGVAIALVTGRLVRYVHLDATLRRSYANIGVRLVA